MGNNPFGPGGAEAGNLEDGPVIGSAQIDGKKFGVALGPNGFGVKVIGQNAIGIKK